MIKPEGSGTGGSKFCLGTEAGDCGSLKVHTH